MAEALKSIKTQMATEKELNVKTNKELETDLTSTKHQLLEIQHQLTLTEKVNKNRLAFSKKFSGKYHEKRDCNCFIEKSWKRTSAKS